MPPRRLSGGARPGTSSDPTSINFGTPKRQLTGTVNLSVPIYSGGAVRNAVAAARTRVEAGRDTLRGTEGDLFTAVVGAYMDVIRDEAIASLNAQNVHVLDVNLQASKDRFQVGDLTRTDVAQSEARLAVARSQLQTAQSQLIASRENYIRVVGSPPQNLETPPPLPNLPSSPDAGGRRRAEGQSRPCSRRRRRARCDALRRRCRQGRSACPSSASWSAAIIIIISTRSVPAPAWPIPADRHVGDGRPFARPCRSSRAASPAAEVRQAQALRGQAIERATGCRAHGDLATRARPMPCGSRRCEVIASSETAVNANKLSLEGVRAENSVGNRTILDILNAEQELLNSQVTLVTAQRDAYVAGFALLAAMGQAEARDLGLDGGALYDPLTNFKSVEHRISDWSDGKPAEAIATSTVGTPAQNANVTDKLDPLANHAG